MKKIFILEIEEHPNTEPRLPANSIGHEVNKTLVTHFATFGRYIIAAREIPPEAMIVISAGETLPQPRVDDCPMCHGTKMFSQSLGDPFGFGSIGRTVPIPCPLCLNV